MKSIKLRKSDAGVPLPDGFSAEDIRVESSVCTGETLIGFYSKTDKRLHYAELCRSDKDIADFYRKYRLKPKT